MSLKKLLCLAIACFAAITWVKAQPGKVPGAPTLTLKDAMEIALQNNYNIRISRNTSKIASNNVTLGNAGILPTINGTYTIANSILNTTQTRSDNTVNRIVGANNTGSNYGATLNWTVFDGLICLPLTMP
jgi:outer membrane protein